MSFTTILWAAAPGGPAPAKPPGPPDSSSLLWASLPVLGVLMLGALALYLADRYRKRTQRRTTSPAGDQLAHFRSLYERGQMSREEFDKVRDLLAEQLRREMDLGPPPPGQTSPAAGPTPTPSPPRLPPSPSAPGPDHPSGNGEAGGEAGNRLA